MSRRFVKITVCLTILLLCLTCAAVARNDVTSSNTYYSLIDEQNHVIHQTGSQVYTGDVYIAADNSKYKVIEVTGKTARCVYQGKESMPSIDTALLEQSLLEGAAVPVVKNASKATIAVYHTHSDESYVPSDGKESINGNGGIYDVGQIFVKQLKAEGFNVVYNKTNHNPHDVNAYNRSRKTASSLLKKTPTAIIDVHRDAVPPGEYQAKVKGQDVTKIKLVVGRSNPNSQTNLKFAKKLKAAMDKVEPGLSEGIFMGKGDYNQDLSPMAMLIEVGAHTNTKEEAERGVKLFAKILPTVLGMSSTSNTASANSQGAEPAKKPASQDNQGSTTTLIILVAVVAVVIGGFFLLNRGSSKG